MSYRFMRIVLFFDLPTLTEKIEETTHYSENF